MTSGSPSRATLSKCLEPNVSLIFSDTDIASCFRLLFFSLHGNSAALYPHFLTRSYHEPYIELSAAATFPAFFSALWPPIFCSSLPPTNLTKVTSVPCNILSSVLGFLIAGGSLSAFEGVLRDVALCPPRTEKIAGDAFHVTATAIISITSR